MKKKSPAFALLWLLLIPGQMMLAGALFSLAASLDAASASNRPDDVIGHPVPVFSMMMAGIIILVTVVVILVSIIVTIVRFIAIRRQNKAIDQYMQMQQYYGQMYPGAPYAQSQYMPQRPYYGNPPDSGLK